MAKKEIQTDKASKFAEKAKTASDAGDTKAAEKFANKASKAEAKANKFDVKAKGFAEKESKFEDKVAKKAQEIADKTKKDYTEVYIKLSTGGSKGLNQVMQFGSFMTSASSMFGQQQSVSSTTVTRTSTQAQHLQRRRVGAGR